MEDIIRAKERLEARRQLVVDLGHACNMLLPASVSLAVREELELHLKYLQQGYTPSSLASEIIEIVKDRENVFDVMISEMRHAAKRNQTTYFDREYIFDLAIELDNYVYIQNDPTNPEWMQIYLESRMATLEARIEIAERAIAEGIA